jgi:hypothetical protein
MKLFLLLPKVVPAVAFGEPARNAVIENVLKCNCVGF